MALLRGVWLMLSSTGRRPRRRRASSSLWVRSGWEPWMSVASDARETANGTGTLLLFRTTSELRGGIGVSGSLGVRLTAQPVGRDVRPLSLCETRRPRSTNDAEGAADTTAEEPLQQFQIEGGVLWAPERWHVGRHLQVYASGGGGYLRQLHEGKRWSRPGPPTTSVAAGHLAAATTRAARSRPWACVSIRGGLHVAVASRSTMAFTSRLP